MAAHDLPLLIFDLDEAVILSTYEQLPKLNVVTRSSGLYVHQRPFLSELLAAVSPLFNVAIWTAASADYARDIVRGAFIPYVTPMFVWSYKRCTIRRNFEQDYWVATKPLVKVKRTFKVPLERMLIIEDDPLKVTANYGNAIYVKPFNGDSSDDELRLLADYLLSIRHIDNFRQVEKRGWRSQVEKIKIK